MPEINQENDPLGLLQPPKEEEVKPFDPIGILKKKVDGKDGGKEKKPAGVPPTQSKSQSQSPNGGAKPSWQTSALNPVTAVTKAVEEKKKQPYQFVSPATVVNVDNVKKYEQAQQEYSAADKRKADISARDEHSIFSPIPLLQDIAGAIVPGYNEERTSNNQFELKNADAELQKTRKIALASQDYIKTEIPKILSPISDTWKDYITYTQDGVPRINEYKIREFANAKSKEYGVQEDGMFYNLVKRETSNLVTQKLIQPEVDKQLKTNFKKLYGKDLDVVLKDEKNQAALKAEELKTNAKTSIEKLYTQISAKAKEDVSVLSTDIISQIDLMNNEMKTLSEGINQKFSPLIKDKKFIGTPEQYKEYEQSFTALQQKEQENKKVFAELNKKYLDIQNATFTKANARAKREAEEIGKIAQAQYVKTIPANTKLQKDIEKLYAQSYNEVLNKNQEIRKTLSYKNSPIVNVSESILSALGNQIKGWGAMAGSESMITFGEDLKETFGQNVVEFKSAKDYLEFDELLKFGSTQLGNMIPGAIGATAVTAGVAATGGAGASVGMQLVSGMLTQWIAETMTTAGNMYSSTLERTGDVAAANNAERQTVQFQKDILPLYAFSGLPFIGKGITKIIGKVAPQAVRATSPTIAKIAGFAEKKWVAPLIAGSAELNEEMIQEYSQNLSEEAITKEGSYANMWAYHTEEKFKNTFLNVAPFAAFGAIGELTGQSEADKKQYAIQQAAKSFALKTNFASLAPGQKEQFLFDVIQRQGAPFAAAYLTSVYGSGQMDKATFEGMQQTYAKQIELLGKTEELGLTPVQAKLYNAFSTYHQNEKKRFEETEDPIMKSIAAARMVEYENALTNIGLKREPNYSVVVYPDNSQMVFMHSELDNALNQPAFAEAVANGDIKVAVFGESKKLNTKIEESKKAVVATKKEEQRVAKEQEANTRKEIETTFNVEIQDNIEGMGVEVRGLGTEEQTQQAKQALREAGINLREDDTENVTGLPSQVGEGQAVVTAESQQGAGTEATGTGGVLQTQGVSGQVQGAGQGQVAQTTTSPTVVNVSNKTELAGLQQRTQSDKNKSAVLESAKKAIATLKSIFPDMEIFIHEDADIYNQTMTQYEGEQNSRGNFVFGRDKNGKPTGWGRIDINLSNASETTVAHEVTHAVLLKAFGDSPATFKKFRDRISPILRADLNKDLLAFEKMYEGLAVAPEEYLTQLSALLAKGAETVDYKPSTLRKIAAVINEFVAKITGGKFQPFKGEVDFKNFVDFLNQVSGAIREGNEINLDAKDSGDVVISNVIPIDKLKSKSDLGYKKHDVKWVVDKKAGIVLNVPKDKKSMYDVVEKSGGAVVVINSDATGIGLTKDNDLLQGGIGYTFIDANISEKIGFAASSDIKIGGFYEAVMDAARKRDEEFPEMKGKPVAVFVMVQTPSAMFGNSYAAEYFGRVLNKITKSKLFDTKEAKKELLDFIQDFKVNNKVGAKYSNSLDALSDLVKKSDFTKKESIQKLIDLLISNRVNEKDKSAKFGFDIRRKFFEKFFVGVGTVKQGAPARNLRLKLKEEGYNHQDFINEFGDKNVVDLLEGDTPGKKQSDGNFTLTGFFVDPYQSKEDFIENSKKGTYQHKQFNSKFYGVDPFVLDGKYYVDKMFPEARFTTEEGVEVPVQVSAAGSMYPRTQKSAKAIIERAENLEFISKSEMAAFNKGIEEVKKNAEEYKKSVKNKNRTNEAVPSLFTKVSKMISDAYGKMKNEPNNKDVKESYDAMMRETIEQYDFIVSKGLNVVKHLGKGEPYANSKEMLRDLKENKTLKFLPNDVAFGQGTSDVKDNIGLQLSGRKLKDGYELTNSEVFRVVHDYFGHGILGNQFGAIGEENATLQHLDLYSDIAAPAVIFQTRGQNSWVNFSGENSQAEQLRKDAKVLMKEGKIEEAKKMLAEAEKIFKFAEPKINIFPNEFNFKRYETARRINDQEAIDSRPDKRVDDLSSLLEEYSARSSATRGVNKRNIRKSKRLGSFDVETIAEYTFDDRVNEGISKAFPGFKGVQKIYEITDGDTYRKMLVDALKDNKFAASVTVHTPAEFNEMRMFVTEDGSTGITITKEGFLGGAFSGDNKTKPYNLTQLMVLGVKEGATTVEAFHTILPNYYSNFGFKAVSRTAFNDEYRPLIKNGNAIKDWDYETYKDFNNGRPDVVFFIYDGGDRNVIEDKLGLFDDYNSYDINNTESFDKDGYDKAENVMKQSAVKRLELDLGIDGDMVSRSQLPEQKKEGVGEEETEMVSRSQKAKVDFGEGQEGKDNKKEFDKLTSTMPNSGEVTKYLSGETIEKYEGEVPRNEQEVVAQQLRPALERGVNIIEKAKQLFGDNYVESLLQYVETENLPPANKALIYVSLENEIAKQKLENPSEAAKIEKMQDLVRAKSQAFLRSNSLAINMGRLRKFAEVGYDVNKLTDRFFSSRQLEDKKKIEDAIQATADDINKEAERIVTEEENIKAKVDEGVREEIQKIYDNLSTDKKKAVDKRLSVLDKIKQNLFNKYTFKSKPQLAEESVKSKSSINNIIEDGYNKIFNAMKAGVDISKAIEIGIDYIKAESEKSTGVKWADEVDFRNDITQEFTSQGLIDTKAPIKGKTPVDRLKQAKQRVRSQIESIQEQINNRQRVEKKDKLIPDAELEYLIKRRDALNSVLDRYVPKVDAYAEERNVKAAKSKLENEILELNRQIQKGQKDKFEKRESRENSELDVLRAEKEARQAILEALDPTPRLFIENALIEQGFGRQINVKTKNGVEQRWVLDWKKLAGEEGSVDNIRERVEAALRDKGYTDEQMLRMQDAFVEEYNNLSESILEKALNEINERNKQATTPEQKSAARKLVEMYNYGLFDKDPQAYETALAKTLGLSGLSLKNFDRVRELGEALSNLFNNNFEGQPLNESQLRSAIQVIEEKMRVILNSEAMQQGNTAFKISEIVKGYMDASQRMMLNTLKQGMENPISGLLERFYSSIGYAGTIPEQLNAQQRKMARDIYKEMVLQKGLGYGNVGNAFISKGSLDAYIHNMSDSQLVQGIMSVAMGKTILDAVDSAYKAKITQQKFTYNLITILTKDRMVNGVLEKGMTKEEAKRYVAEKISGQSFEDAKKTAKDIIENINTQAGKKIFNDSPEFVSRLATDIVNAALVNGEKITTEMVTAAYNAAYKAAGRGLGHVANNIVSETINTQSGKLESRISDAIKQKKYNKAAYLNFISIFYRNIANPFVGGGTNWIVLKAEKTGLGLISGLVSKIADKGTKMDLMTETGMKELEDAMYSSMKTKDMFVRGAVGAVVTTLAFVLIKATGADDEYEKWIKKNQWAKKYLSILTPEIMLAMLATRKEGAYKKYLEASLNQNEAFDKGKMALKVLYSEDKATAAGVLLNSSIGNPIPWRLVRDGQQIWAGATGGEPYAINPVTPKSFGEAFLKGGMFDYLGIAPTSEDKSIIVSSKEFDSPKYKAYKDKEIKMPKLDKKDSYEIPEEIRADKKMTDEEFDKFSKLVREYELNGWVDKDEVGRREKYYGLEDILDEKYRVKERKKRTKYFLGKELPKEDLQDKVNQLHRAAIAKAKEDLGFVLNKKNKRQVTHK